MLTPLPPPPGAPPKPVERSPSSRRHLRDMVDSLFNAEVAELVQVAIALAKRGDPVLLRWIIDRSSPPRRSRAIEVPGGIRAIKTIDDALQEMARLAELAAAGVLCIEEAAAVVDLLRSFIAASDVADLARRVAQLEQSLIETRSR
jgi:hypothetical protein